MLHSSRILDTRVKVFGRAKKLLRLRRWSRGSTSRLGICSSALRNWAWRRKRWCSSWGIMVPMRRWVGLMRLHVLLHYGVEKARTTRVECESLLWQRGQSRRATMNGRANYPSLRGWFNRRWRLFTISFQRSSSKRVLGCQRLMCWMGNRWQLYCVVDRIQATVPIF